MQYINGKDNTRGKEKAKQEDATGKVKGQINDKGGVKALPKKHHSNQVKYKVVAETRRKAKAKIRRKAT